MDPTLELLDYDLEGAAYDAKGNCVDGAFLHATVRRRAVIANGTIVTSAGDPTRLRIDVATFSPADKADLLVAFGTHEGCVLALATPYFIAQGADPKALDAKIAAADAAVKAKADADAAKAEALAQLDAINAQIAAANQLHAEKLAAVAAIPSP